VAMHVASMVDGATRGVGRIHRAVHGAGVVCGAGGVDGVARGMG
jgi:hypothetical protein